MKNKAVIAVIWVLVLAVVGILLYRHYQKTPDATKTSTPTQTSNQKILASPPVTDQTLYSISGTVTAVTKTQITLKTSLLKTSASGSSVIATETKIVPIAATTVFVTANKVYTDIKPGSKIDVFYYKKTSDTSTTITTASKVQLSK